MQATTVVPLNPLPENRRGWRLAETRRGLARRALGEGVRELPAILDEDGYVAGARTVDDGRSLTGEHASTVRRVAERYGQARSSEIGVRRDAVPEAGIRRVTPIAGGRAARSREIRRTDHSNQEM